MKETKTIKQVTTQDGYDKWAVSYDFEDNPLVVLEEPIFKSMLGDVSGKSVLELGCGTGRHSHHIFNKGARLTAVDFSDEMLLVARQKMAEGVQFVRHDIHKPWPFETDSFDLVVSSLVLEHVKFLMPFFGEAKRVSKKGARILFTTMHPAMFLRDKQAHYYDANENIEFRFESYDHQISDFINAAINVELTLNEVNEYMPNESTFEKSPKSRKFINWPMLLTLDLTNN